MAAREESKAAAASVVYATTQMRSWTPERVQDYTVAQVQTRNPMNVH